MALHQERLLTEAILQENLTPYMDQKDFKAIVSDLHKVSFLSSCFG
jgi:anti-anti-sigma regulatory factor